MTNSAYFFSKIKDISKQHCFWSRLTHITFVLLLLLFLFCFTLIWETSLLSVVSVPVPETKIYVLVLLIKSSGSQNWLLTQKCEKPSPREQIIASQYYSEQKEAFLSCILDPANYEYDEYISVSGHLVYFCLEIVWWSRQHAKCEPEGLQPNYRYEFSNNAWSPPGCNQWNISQIHFTVISAAMAFL